jgi:CTP synthase (UTP-ammonia lyase)
VLVFRAAPEELWESSPSFAREAADLNGQPERGEVRALQLRAHPFFLATLFQPQLSSSAERPHPIVEGFLRASTGALG